MTLKTYLEEQNKQKKMLKIYTALVGALTTLIFLKETLIAVGVILLIYTIPGLLYLFMYNEYKEKRKVALEKLMPYKNSSIYAIKHRRSKGVHQMRQELFMIPILMLIYMLILEFFNSIWMQLTLIAIITLLMLVGYYFVKKIYMYPLVMFNEGFMIHQKFYFYNDIKKYQWIELRDQNWMLEIRTKDFYSSLTLTETEHKKIQKYLLQS